MLILPESGIDIIVLVNTNDYFVTDGMMEPVSDSIVLMLSGESPIEISKTKCFLSHLILNVIYFIVFILALLPLAFLKRYKKKLVTKKLDSAIIRLGLLHIGFPTCLLLVPTILYTPIWAVRYYVPDFFIVLIVSAVLLYLGDAIKAILLFKK